MLRIMSFGETLMRSPLYSSRGVVAIIINSCRIEIYSHTEDSVGRNLPTGGREGQVRKHGGGLAHRQASRALEAGMGVTENALRGNSKGGSSGGGSRGAGGRHQKQTPPAGSHSSGANLAVAKKRLQEI